MSKPEICDCVSCRSTTTIPAPRDLKSAIDEQRKNDSSSLEDRQLRVVKALRATPVEGAKTK